MKKLVSLGLAFLGLFAAFTAPASAIPLNYVLTGDYSASWTMDSNPVPGASPGDIISGAPGLGFTVADVQGNFPGATFDYVADVSFFDIGSGGGLVLTDAYNPPIPNFVDLVITDGQQLYSGSALAPTMLLGTFSLVDSLSGPGRYTLTVSAVPEPQTWAMLLVGFFGVGFALRTRKRLNVSQITA
jgi:hypothetical protein